MRLERGHCLTLHFDKQSSVRARIDFAPISTSTEAGVVQRQAMPTCFPLAGCSKWHPSKAAGSPATEAYPWGTLQGDGRLRTPLTGFFSSLVGD